MKKVTKEEIPYKKFKNKCPNVTSDNVEEHMKLVKKMKDKKNDK